MKSQIQVLPAHFEKSECHLNCSYWCWKVRSGLTQETQPTAANVPTSHNMNITMALCCCSLETAVGPPSLLCAVVRFQVLPGKLEDRPDAFVLLKLKVLTWNNSVWVPSMRKRINQAGIVVADWKCWFLRKFSHLRSGFLTESAAWAWD